MNSVTTDLEIYAAQAARLPAAGRHVLAAYDATSVVVYQAYRPSIGLAAVREQSLGRAPGFSRSRMSWIKPGFRWMMYRASWASAADQQCILAIRLRRAAFDEILAAAVPSSFWRERYAEEAEWKREVASSEVRVQWDPDHDPAGAPLERRALQLGLRGSMLGKLAAGCAGPWVESIEDVTAFVREQHAHANDHAVLRTPREGVYAVADARVAQQLRIGE